MKKIEIIEAENHPWNIGKHEYFKETNYLLKPYEVLYVFYGDKCNTVINKTNEFKHYNEL